MKHIPLKDHMLSDPFDLLTECRICPRSCGVNRKSMKGYCGQGLDLKVAYVGPHFGEEPPITCKNGSGTVFFGGCVLKCSYCQNYQISHLDIGEVCKLEVLEGKIIDMINTYHPHNINLVTFDHFTPHVMVLVDSLRSKGIDLPIVANVSGYHKVSTLRLWQNYIDIYLVDYKYSQEDISYKLSKARDYPLVALDSISEMVRQKGMLSINSNNGVDVAKKGVLVRHLILPGYIDNSIRALDMLFCEFGKDLPISIMSQYEPVIRHRDNVLNRRVNRDEFLRVLDYANHLGFQFIFYQLPEDDLGRKFLPDFGSSDPFNTYGMRQGIVSA